MTVTTGRAKGTPNQEQNDRCSWQRLPDSSRFDRCCYRNSKTFQQKSTLCSSMYIIVSNSTEALACTSYINRSEREIRTTGEVGETQSLAHDWIRTVSAVAEQFRKVPVPTPGTQGASPQSLDAWLFNSQQPQLRKKSF
jgi:hypothetical protein